MHLSERPLFFVRIRASALPGLKCVFKRLAGDVRASDPDLQVPYDIVYPSDNDCRELVARLLLEHEALTVCERVRDALSSFDPTAATSVELVQVDLHDPLNCFQDMAYLLRLLPYKDQSFEQTGHLDDLMFGWASSRKDGVRRERGRLLYRRREHAAQMCFAVSARRISPGQEANVVARYGTWHRNIEEPLERLERYGFLEWEYPFFGWESEDVLVSVSRALNMEQANRIVEVLRQNSGSFQDIAVSAEPLRTFSATEGLLSGDAAFARASDEEEREIGFPYFLSVWED